MADMYKVMILFKTLDGSCKEVDSGYYATDLEKADDMRYDLMAANPNMNCVIYREDS